MKCPYCDYDDSKVVDSRPTDDNQSIRRRRECLKCKKRFTTYERLEKSPIVVVKKDGTRQSYDRSKLLNGMIRACEKRPVSLSRLEEAVDNIEKKIHNSLEREIKSQDIGEMVMLELKEIDEISYVRFASVYRQFKDINSFMEEIMSIKSEVDEDE
ncbi:MAG: transcriptional repressor NrdR [Tissierellia bacterium]|jgi:transcriptional repressor NrdR|nr:transcriptional repressor NrdR [Tissierellia bacterium]